jgi:DNA-3-methyladenine glycosylase I
LCAALAFRRGQRYTTAVSAKPRIRCPWAGDDPLYLAYHDEEWGVPLRDGRSLFELLVLEGFQAGLSWITILRKREAFRRAFHGFDPARVARLGPADVERLLANPAIVRNRAKIEGAIKSAQAFLACEGEGGGGFARLAWSFVGGTPRVNRPRRTSDVPAETDESRAMSRELRRRGFVFVGPTICYAFMQASGMVNDHLVGCFRHAELAGRVGRARRGGPVGSARG